MVSSKAKGYFAEAGLDVDIVHPSVTQTAMSRIRNNKSQATTLQLCQAMEIIDNGTGPKIYKIHKSTIDTIDEMTESPLMGFEKADKQGLSDIPFL